MMGPKTLATIKTELRDALARTGQDPIDWLEERISLLEKASKPEKNEIELLAGLLRLLKDPKTAGPRAKRTRTSPRR